MKILFDIGHPGHLHYFRNAAKILEEEGHKTFFTTRDKDVTLKLFKAYNIPYYLTGKNKSGLLNKAYTLFKTTWEIYKYAKKVKPDIIVNFFLPFAGIAGRILNIPVIGFDDTEHAKFSNWIAKKFTDIVFVPSSFLVIHDKHEIRFDSHMELCYLLPKYHTPDKKVLNELKISPGTEYVILRFISWTANHDLGASGLKYDEKIKLVKLLSSKFQVFISSEGQLPPELSKYRINISPEKIHDALYFAQLYIGEGATMASEAALLGTPSIYINSLDAGCLQAEVNAGLLYSFRDSNGLFDKIEYLLAINDLKQQHINKNLAYLKKNIDVTALLVWFIENYPQSKMIMRESPDFQFNFRTDNILEKV